jgi:hypothetical protein
VKLQNLVPADLWLKISQQQPQLATWYSRAWLRAFTMSTGAPPYKKMISN